MKKNQKSASQKKREMILQAATEIFAEHGLEGASLRAVAARADYTPAALYFHFDSKEALYFEVLQSSLKKLGEQVAAASKKSKTKKSRLSAVAMAFFKFYAKHPRDLDLGFYLFRGGMKPAGLGKVRDIELNKALETALEPIADSAIELGATKQQAKLLMVDTFAHATGLLLLLHTGRIRMFAASAEEMMQQHIKIKIDTLAGRK